MKRLLVIAALVTLFSVDAGATLLPTLNETVITMLKFNNIPAGQSPPCVVKCDETIKVYYETVGSTVPENFDVIFPNPPPLWLSAIPSNANTPANIKLVVDTAVLSEGFSDTVTIQFQGEFGSGSLMVMLTVGPKLEFRAGTSSSSINETVAPGERKDVNLEITSDVDTSQLSAPGKGIPSFAVGEVNWTAVVTLLSEPGTDWFTISLTSGTATPDNPSQVTATVDAAQLPGPGTYQAEIAVTSNPTVIVPVTVVVRSPGPRLSVSQNAVLFQSVSSGPFTISETVTITNEGDGTLDWSLSGLPTWLTASTESGSVVSGPAGEDVVLTADPSSFGSGINTALLTVSAPAASNNPQVVTAVLLTVPGATPATAEVSPNALVFVAEVGQPLPPKRTVSVSNVGGGTLAFNFSATITSPPGGNWLTLAGQGGAAPAQVTVLVNPSGLPLGVYEATLIGTFGGGARSEVQVVLFVVAPGTTLRALARGLPGAAQCGPEELQVLATTIGTGLSLPVSFPRVLTALVVDDCGSGVDNATVVASVEGLNIPLRSLGTGFYSGTWVPQSVATAVTLTFDALHPTFKPEFPF